MFKLKVYYEDTDAAGVVYYANYLKFLERARTEFILNKGLSNIKLKENYNIFLVVKSCNIEFLKSAYLEEELFVETKIDKISRVQIYLTQNILKNETTILKAKIRIAVVNNLGKVTRFSDQLFSLFNKKE